MPLWPRLLQTGLFVIAGAFVMALAVSTHYWRFLNPKYAWLSLAAGAALVILGFLSPGGHGQRARSSETLGLLVFTSLALAAVGLPNPFFDVPAAGEKGLRAPPSSFSDAPLHADPEQAAGPDLLLGGQVYTRINIAELLVLEGKGLLRENDAYAVQGMVRRTAELDKAGLMAVTRIFIVCCFADAQGVACLVRVDDPANYAPGQWVRVAGVLRSAENVPPSVAVSVPGTIASSVARRFVLHARDIASDFEPGLPFIFEVRDSKPFAY